MKDGVFMVGIQEFLYFLHLSLVSSHRVHQHWPIPILTQFPPGCHFHVRYFSAHALCVNWDMYPTAPDGPDDQCQKTWKMLKNYNLKVHVGLPCIKVID